MEYSTKHLDYIARSFLDNYEGVYRTVVGPDDVIRSPSAGGLLRITRVSRTWLPPGEGQPADDQPHYRSEALLTGCYGMRLPLVFAVIGSPDGITMLLGARSAQHAGPDPTAELRTLLDAHYPGSRVTAWDGEQFERCVLDTVRNGSLGIVTGLPTATVGDETDRPTQLDRVIRGMAGRSWGIVGFCDPQPQAATQRLQHSVVNEMRNVENAEQTKQRRGPIAEDYLKRLESLAKEFDQGTATGMWSATVFFFAPERQTFRALGSAISGCFGGQKSLPDPIRCIELSSPGALASGLGQLVQKTGEHPGLFEYPYRFQTLLSSTRLATLLHVPRLEAPGLTIRDGRRFDVAAHSSPGEASVGLGTVTDFGRALSHEYVLDREALNKHVLIAGVTGSGKTNTSFHLLRQLWAARIPFLVLEPAKTEYRALIGDPLLGPDLRVHTLGNETVAPLRLNPFEIEEGVSLATHIDLLSSTFNASFAMWSPLPQVLERCLHEVYRDRGWDPIRGTNRRLPAGEVDPAVRAAAFPTLRDLAAKVEEVVDRLGYEARVTSDLKAALVTRLESLRIGGKGAMLDTQRSMPIRELLAHPTVVELEQIGDDDEKAFLMGLLLTRLYEHRQATGATEGSHLRHVVVVEEAHRLLENVPTFASPEQSNTRGKAVETFVNLLSEVRAYGQGFLIAEQIATKLAPDALKNTNVKVVHRTVSGDDRDVVARTMNMDEDDSRMLALLEPGEALVFAEGDDRPLSITVPYAKVATPAAMGTKAGSDRAVREHMTPLPGGDLELLLQPFPTCARVCGSAFAFCAEVEQFTRLSRFKEAYAALVLGLVESAAPVEDLLAPVTAIVNAEAPANLPLPQAMHCVFNHASRWYFSTFGRRYEWSYPTVDRLSELVVSVLTSAVRGVEGEADRSELRRLYQQACVRSRDPFPACARVCPDGRCVFRFHNDALLRDAALTELFDIGMAAAGAQDHGWSDLRGLDQAAVRLGASHLPTAARRSAALCFGVQQIAFKPRMLGPARIMSTDRLIAAFDARESADGRDAQ